VDAGLAARDELAVALANLLGAMQLGRVSQEQRVWSAIMLRPGKDGASLLQACKATALIQASQKPKGLARSKSGPYPTWRRPEEHRRATEAARGSRGGATAGNNLRRAPRSPPHGEKP